MRATYGSCSESCEHARYRSPICSRFQKIPSTSAGKKAEAAIENADPTMKRMLSGRRTPPSGDHRDDQQLRFRDHEAALCRRVGFTIL